MFGCEEGKSGKRESECKDMDLKERNNVKKSSTKGYRGKEHSHGWRTHTCDTLCVFFSRDVYEPSDSCSSGICSGSIEGEQGILLIRNSFH